MITPDYLKKGDTIGIVSPSGRISEDLVTNSIQILNELGFRTHIGNNALGKHNKYSGTDVERVSDFQQMIDNSNIKAILCSRGGYGAMRVIEKLDFSNFFSNPKWVIGLSDITVFHSFLNRKYQIETIHGIMCGYFPKVGEQMHEGIKSLIDALGGEKLEYHIPANNYNRYGSASGRLVGGNLSMIHALMGTPYEIETKNAILFIEDIGEYHYRIDRMLMTLKLAGKFEGLKGLIVGQFTDMNDDKFGSSIPEIISEIIEGLNIPVIFNFQAGHIKNSLALIMGREVEMKVDKIVRLNFK